MDTKLRFDVKPGWSAEFTIGETRTLIQSAMSALRTVPRVKCATCRCHILPGDECFCCKHRVIEEDEHVEQPIDTGFPDPHGT